VIDHFEFKVVRFAACKHFYQAALAPLGIEVKWSDEAAAGFGRVGEPRVAFLIEAAAQSTPCHIAFTAPDRAAVAAFHEAGLKAGGRDHGAPGLRENYAPNYYAAFLRDPDGNNVEAVVRL
jgi:catechol 2,3-dioxygenase-like lactoylglutathione lyase family enzyme